MKERRDEEKEEGRQRGKEGSKEGKTHRKKLQIPVFFFSNSYGLVPSGCLVLEQTNHWKLKA